MQHAELAPARRRAAWLWCWLLACCSVSAAQRGSEYQVKAAFLFQFTQFVEWPAAAFAGPEAPLVIGVLGEDPFGPLLDQVLAGQHGAGRTLQVRRIRELAEAGHCQLLFVSSSEARRWPQIRAALQARPILTVADFEGFASQAGMIRLLTAGGRVHLRINPEAARSAGLVLDSRLLRLAERVGSGQEP